ncbi:hypothetical protein BCR39DRAFT_20738 [Naematelia encephala]|uniref:Uncharacterized protein n=1 Tax=Naematelia encephala TaxID=71784 RepID=A0A1Y2BLB9_9TREE|nr:hypothetical protein BCR39DRAFT_20738 [Naematelia encephala]
MKAASQRVTRSSPSPLLRQVSTSPPSLPHAPALPPVLPDTDTDTDTDTNTNTDAEVERGSPSSLNDGLAICLFGVSREMYDIEYEEEMRKQAVMNEVLPDAEMWRKWANSEAPLRRVRGWNPDLDRYFLQLLVESEILCLANPLNAPNPSGPPGQADRIHRHASRVRRVACDRIGIERLQAYCDRVREAFEAYMMTGWRGFIHDQNGKETGSDSDEEDNQDGRDEQVRDESEGEKKLIHEQEDDEDEDEDEERGRSIERGKGSVVRDNKEPRGGVVRDTMESEDLALDLDQEGMMRIELDDVHEVDEVSNDKTRVRS